MTSLQQIAVTFRAQVAQKPPIRAGRECLEVAFKPEHELELAWRNAMGDRPARFFNELRSGRFTIQLITIASDERDFKLREYPIHTESPVSPH
jgi:hypothetical protein